MPHSRLTPSLLVLFSVLITLPATASDVPPGPLGGLERLHVWLEEPQNLLANASFEVLDAAGKPSGWRIGEPGHLFAEAGDARHGSWSLRLQDSHLAERTPTASVPLKLSPGWYNLRGFARAEAAGTNKAAAGGRIALTGAGTTGLVRGTQPWTLIERRDLFVEPTDRPQVRIEAYQKPDGSLSFDDLQLRRLKPPAVEGFLLYPNYRGVLFEDASQLVRLQVRARPGELGMTAPELRVEAVLATEDGAPVVRRVIDATASPVVVALDASAAPAGVLRLSLRALRAVDGKVLFEYPSYRLHKLPVAARPTLRNYIDADNVAVLDGRRRFVLGIYDTSGYSNNPAYYDRRISAIAEAPFNLYLNYWLGRAPDSALKALTGVLRQYGMSYLHTVNKWYADQGTWSKMKPCGGRTPAEQGEEAYWACRASALGDDPALAGWYTADEQPASAAASVFRQYDVLRRHDPGGITFIAQNSAPEFSRWRDAADAFDLHEYPIYKAPEGTLSPLESVLAHTDAAQAAVAGSRPVWAVIQYFEHGAGSHFPTYDELRSMSYMAIVSGAKGLLYWSYGAVGLSWVSDPALQEEYWQRLVRLTREIEALEPVLLSPDDPAVVRSASAPQVRWLAKRWNGARYLIAVNTTAEAGVSASFHLAGSAGRAEVVGENLAVASFEDPAVALLDDGTLNDVFGPYEVRVYRLPGP